MNITTPKAVGIDGLAGGGAGPPIYVSPPFFCLCDGSLAEAVDGLPDCRAEDPVAHQTFIDVEPLTGVPMRGQLRIMVSSEITTQVGGRVAWTFIR